MAKMATRALKWREADEMKMPVPCRTAALCVVAFLAPAAVMAQVGWISLLKNTAAEKFDDEDLHLFMQAGRQALDHAAEHETVTWANPKTGSRGQVTVRTLFTWHQHPCRRLRVENEAAGKKDGHTVNFCRVEERWRLVTASQLASEPNEAARRP